MSDVALDWSPFGGNPVPGDPGRVRGLAQNFRDFVGQVGQQHSLLMDVHNGVGGVWMSPAGRAFSPHLGQLPGQLQKLHTSYNDAADALDGYWPELQDAQTMATTALAKVHAALQAQQAAKAAQAQDYQAFQTHQAELQQQAQQKADQTGLPVTLQIASYSPSPGVVAQTDQANQAYQAAMNLKAQAVQKAQSAAQRLSSQLDGASKAGIQNPGFSLFGWVHDVESWWDDGTHWVDQHAGAIETVLAATALGPAGLLLTSDGRALLEHAMKAMNPVFEVVSGVCGVVSFGLAIVGFIPGVGEVADVLNEGVTLIKTGADAGMLIDGKLDGDSAEVKEAEENLVGDGLGLATGGMSRAVDGVAELGADASKVEELTETTNELRSTAAEADVAAGQLSQRVSTYKTLSALNRFEGRTSLADKFSATADDLHSQQLAKEAESLTARTRVGALEKTISETQESAAPLRTPAGIAKQVSGLRTLERVRSGEAMGGFDDGVLSGLKAGLKEEYGAEGNHVAQTLRVAKTMFDGSLTGKDSFDLPKNIRQIANA